uniref:Uncharacterized protein n=1 Tax=Panagrolaimus sp. PS1159 TaxID=55785 RepID=A0AC35F055_9BILA
MLQALIQLINQQFQAYLLKADPFVRFDLNFGTNETFFIDGFFYDNQTLSHWDGTIFSPTKNCVYDIFTDTGFVRNRTQCCTKFSPGISASINYPKCKRFKSRTTVHNLDFSIFGTSSVNYTLSDGVVEMNGNWDGQETAGFEFGNKFFEGSDPKKQFSMNYTLPSGDSKPFFTTIFVVNGLPIAVEDVIAFIIDGNNTLMKEATPYTKENDCSYHSFAAIRGGVPLPTTVEMCCKEFES